MTWNTRVPTPDQPMSDMASMPDSRPPLYLMLVSSQWPSTTMPMARTRSRSAYRLRGGGTIAPGGVSEGEPARAAVAVGDQAGQRSDRDLGGRPGTDVEADRPGHAADFLPVGGGRRG